MPIDPSKWEKLLGQLDTSGGGDVYYIKQPKTKLRLLLPSMNPATPDISEDDDVNFFAETTKHYQGKPSTAFLVFALIIGTSDKADTNASMTRVRAVRLPKTALRAIVGALSDGHELFDPRSGHGITLARIGGGQSDRTSYTVSPLPEPTPISLGELEWPSKDLWEIADEESNRSAERDLKKQGQDAAKDRQKGRRSRPADEDDEEDLPF